MGKHIFISHSTTDKHYADELCNSLERVGISCWIAPRDIQPGQSWAEAIVQGIEESTVLLLLLSEKSNISKHVIREVELADGREKILFTIKLDNVQPSKSLEYFVRLPQSMDCPRADFDRRIKDIIRELNHYFPDFRIPELDVSLPQPWQQLNQHGISIIMGRFNQQIFKQWERSGLIGYGGVMAYSHLNNYLSKGRIANYSLTFADQTHEDLLQNNLVLLGGDNNKISLEFTQKVKTNIVNDYGVTFTDLIHSRRYSALVTKSGDEETITTDYCLIVYANSPFAQGRRVLFIAGCFGFGTWGGVKYVTSYQFMQHELVKNGTPLECLVEVDVRNETVHEIKPLIIRPLPIANHK